MKTTYRYYCLYRPPMPGTIPRGPINIEDFGERRMIDEISRPAWGFVEYPRQLTPHEVYEYELAEAPAKDVGCESCRVD